MTDEDKKYEALCDAPIDDLVDFMDNASVEELSKLANAAGRWLANQPKKYVRMDYKEALMFASGFVVEAGYTSTIFCRFPPEWINGEENVDGGKLEKVFQILYGADWHSGNADGSRYLVLRPEIHVLSPAEEQNQPWRNVNLQDKSHHYWFFKASDTREVVKVRQTDF